MNIVSVICKYKIMNGVHSKMSFKTFFSLILHDLKYFDNYHQSSYSME